MHLELCQTSKIERLAKIGFHLLTIFAKLTILNVLQGSKYVSEVKTRSPKIFTRLSGRGDSESDWSDIRTIQEHNIEILLMISIK